MSELPKLYLIDEALAQAILDYLKLQPYVEVYKLIHALQELPPVDGEKPVEVGEFLGVTDQ